MSLIQVEQIRNRAVRDIVQALGNAGIKVVYPDDRAGDDVVDSPMSCAQADQFERVMLGALEGVIERGFAELLDVTGAPV